MANKRGATRMIGQTLGHYHIVEKLGEGGMGVVYRARDTRLGRDVAIKVLPEAFSRDPERLARFRREAQLLASLNHPNIAVIYDLEEADDVRFLVLEFVAGEILAGPLPVEEALPICRQIAEALEAAHEKGIVHRDLKPANVKVTPEGKVKVLDFGLAKAFLAEGSAADLSHSPTISVAATRAGVILGTVAYMSPEQARGRPVDKRADIWAFGCILYEMLTGKQVFPGETVSDSMAAILKQEPDWAELPPGSPVHLLRRCLQKDPQRRLRDIGDTFTEEESPASAIHSTVAAATPIRNRGWLWGLIGLVGGIALGSALWSWIQALRRPLPRMARFVVAIPGDDRLAIGNLPALALSPDGTRLVYVGARGNSTQLFLRPLDRTEATPIPGSEGADGSFFSPDGGWLGFFADGKLKKVALSGGSPVTLCEATNPRGGVWTPDQNIIFSPSVGTGLFRIPAAGGMPQALTKPDTAKGETSHRLPELLPGGEALFFTLKTAKMKTFDDASIAVLSLKTGRYRTLVEGGTNARYVPTDHLVYVRSGQLLAASFDPQRLELTGPPVPVAQDIAENPDTGAASFAFSNEGILVFAPGGLMASDYTLVWVDRKGTPRALPAPARPYYTPRISPDGRRVALDIGAAYDDVWVYELERATLTRLTFASGSNYGWPVWAPDGKRLAFRGTRSNDLLWKTAMGSGPEERLFGGEKPVFPTSWSPDGKVLAFTQMDPKTGADIWLLPLDGERKPKPLLQTPFAEIEAKFSPDGRWLAYASDESGRSEIYVTSFPSGEGKWQVSTEGGTEAAWARNGRELFYRNGDKMMAVAIETQAGFHAGKPAPLFEGTYERHPIGAANYDVSPDGRQFLMVKGQQASGRQLHVALNWFEELRRRAK